MEKYLEQLTNVSMRAILLIGLGVGLLYYLIWYNDGSRLEKRIKVAQQDVQEKQKKIKKIKKEIEDGRKFERELNTMIEAYQKALEYIPNEFSVFELTRTISDEARAAGTNILKISPKAERDRKEFYEEMSVDIELEGSFGELTLFLANISKVRRILNTKDLQVSERTGSELLRFKGTLVGYRYVEEEEEKEAGK